MDAELLKLANQVLIRFCVSSKPKRALNRQRKRDIDAVFTTQRAVMRGSHWPLCMSRRCLHELRMRVAYKKYKILTNS
jgi:hypothetical protein